MRDDALEQEIQCVETEYDRASETTEKIVAEYDAAVLPVALRAFEKAARLGLYRNPFALRDCDDNGTTVLRLAETVVRAVAERKLPLYVLDVLEPGTSERLMCHTLPHGSESARMFTSMVRLMDVSELLSSGATVVASGLLRRIFEEAWQQAEYDEFDDEYKLPDTQRDNIVSVMSVLRDIVDERDFVRVGVLSALCRKFADEIDDEDEIRPWNAVAAAIQRNPSLHVAAELFFGVSGRLEQEDAEEYARNGGGVRFFDSLVLFLTDELEHAVAKDEISSRVLFERRISELRKSSLGENTEFGNAADRYAAFGASVFASADFSPGPTGEPWM